MKKLMFLFSAVLLLMPTKKSEGFCGFYVAKADAKLFNKSSQVILVRDGNRLTVTMSNDYQGDVKDFAMVVPVPSVLKKEDIKLVEASLFSKFDSYSGPRLVEYYDNNPCYQEYLYEMNDLRIPMVKSAAIPEGLAMKKDKDYQVKIEAKYSVGEYDILILSAKESGGLQEWLLDNGYKIPETAKDVLTPYIKSKMKFFVVKVNLERQQQNGFSNLRPLQITYESNKFMLPIRLGMANSTGYQDLIIYSFTRTGRTECTNYRTTKIPTDKHIPNDIRSKFGQFYVDLFKKSWKYEGKNSVFLEYAWNVSPTWGGVKCDPCVGPPPIVNDLTQAGVSWANNQNVFFTRMHVRYNRKYFPQDLLFQETPNREHFQGRYIMTNPATGGFDCEEGQEYVRNLTYRRKREVEELAALTGWNVDNYKMYVNEYRKYLKKDDIDRGDFLPVGNDNNGNDGGPMNQKFWFTLLLSSMVVSILLIGRKRLSAIKS